MFSLFTRATSLDVVRRGPSTMRVMLSAPTNHDENEPPVWMGKAEEHMLEVTERMEASLDAVIEELKAAEDVNKIVFEWTREDFLTDKLRGELVQAAALVQGLRELVFVNTADEKRLHSERNHVPISAVTYVLENVPNLSRIKLGRSVRMDGTQEQADQLAAAIAQHRALQHCILHGSVGGRDNVFRRDLIINGIAKSKTLETVHVAEYTRTVEQHRPATSETAKLLKMPNLRSLELSRAHLHFIGKGIAPGKPVGLLYLTIWQPWGGTGLDRVCDELQRHESIKVFEIRVENQYNGEVQQNIEELVERARYLPKLRLIVIGGTGLFGRTQRERLCHRVIRNGNIQVECLQYQSEKLEKVKLNPEIQALDQELRVQSVINRAGRRILQSQPGDRRAWLHALETLTEEPGSLHQTRCLFTFFLMNPDLLSAMAARTEESASAD